MSRGYLGGRRQARKHYHWSKSRRTHRRASRQERGRSSPASSANEWGSMCALLVVLGTLYAGLCGLALLMRVWQDDPRLGWLVSVGVGCAVAGGIWWMRRRTQARVRVRVPMDAQAQAETVAARNERIMTQAWMETVARDGKDARLKSLAQSWLEGDRLLRDLRAERTQTAQLRAYEEWCVAARAAGLTEEDLGLDEWASGLTGFREEGLVQG